MLYANGVSAPHIVGIALNGVGTALIRDTDHGRLDGDKVYDRAVGPMQFIPSTWAIFGADGNGDHVADPFNLFDAAQAAANYLCAAGGNLRTSAGQIQAVMSYNHSVAYLRMVLQLEKTYAAGHFDVRITIPAGAPPTSSPKRLPPVNDGPPITSTTRSDPQADPQADVVLTDLDLPASPGLLRPRRTDVEPGRTPLRPGSSPRRQRPHDPRPRPGPPLRPPRRASTPAGCPTSSVRLATPPGTHRPTSGRPPRRRRTDAP